MFKKSKKSHFSKVVNQWFWSRKGHFSTFFLRNIGQENVFYDILERKNTFLGYKNKKFKKSKNGHFSKGDNPWFWSKNGHFSTFFFSLSRPEIFFQDMLEGKKSLSMLSKPEIQKVGKIGIFPKGLNDAFFSKNCQFSNFFFQAIQARKMSFMIF